jgi:hypothetical protein
MPFDHDPQTATEEDGALCAVCPRRAVERVRICPVTSPEITNCNAKEFRFGQASSGHELRYGPPFSANVISGTPTTEMSPTAQQSALVTH